MTQKMAALIIARWILSQTNKGRKLGAAGWTIERIQAAVIRQDNEVINTLVNEFCEGLSDKTRREYRDALAGVVKIN